MASQWRTVRVFISSTFRDMHAEREELVKRIFPQLRRMCEQRGITWGEVDLRWGVTDEQKAEGRVLPICLEEIKRCRPFFIGLLGERYGWLPEHISQELIDREPWLREHLGHSVTELEILHGVLNNPAMANRALFYFRDPAHVDSVPAARRKDFIEQAPENRRKLAALKERIRASGLALQENYPDPKTLGEWVLRDLTVAINQEFPPGTEPSSLEQEAAMHEAFARSRARVYIGRKEYFKHLDDHAAGDGPPLVVLGESGVGKSALLSNWALAWREAHPNDLVILHFIGASPASADWAAMLRRAMGELKQRFGIEGEIPDRPDALRSAFANWLHMAAARGRTVLVLDALNQLEDRDGAPDLVWLPPVIPENVRLVLSTLPGRALDNLRRRGWPTLEVNPLAVEERRQLIAEYLGQYTKALSPGRTERVAAAPQTANPLYLRTLLEELRVFGEHERLDERIGHYLQARTIPDLYAKVLQRWEEDYETERPGLVRDALVCLWSARQGLSEAELLDLLGSGGEPLPRVVLSPLFLAADQALVNRGGLLGFFHDYLLQAVADAYLPTQQAQTDAHLRLANYFDGQALGRRKVVELPWQLAQAQVWRRLYGLLTDSGFLEVAWTHNNYNVREYWLQLESIAGLSMASAYRRVVKGLPSNVRQGKIVAILLFGAGYIDEALRATEHLSAYYRADGDNDMLQLALNDMAKMHFCRGQFDKAISLLNEQRTICQVLGYRAGLASCLEMQALILDRRGDRGEAMILLKEMERLCHEDKNRTSLARCLHHQAGVLHVWSDLEGSMALYKQSERIAREMGDIGCVVNSMANQASLLSLRGATQAEAVPLARRAHGLAIECGLLDEAKRITRILEWLQSPNRNSTKLQELGGTVGGS